MLNVAIGDWVVATTSEDEMVHGYVEAIAWQHGIAFVHVIASDQDEIIGHQIEVKLSSVKALPISGLDSEDGVRSMIDIALGIKDEMWFMELTDTLLSLQLGGAKSTKDKVIPGFYANRLGVDQL
ncbi:hypothetical protein ASG89_07985 [Paenibacillus sp. Soil766]|uniref:hypothetical protein n=1 Tax=Paenibacillus sp. Soil766 TaxID=1736404 RepID=UPI00070B935A|nr:hypothetical protein [Paenibacillus sp. Soil766]KRE90238.1 hypothetical protein ASG89_07985 [Paenibacillus sp. Soil766]